MAEEMGCPTFVCALTELMIVRCFYIDLLVCEEGVQVFFTNVAPSPKFLASMLNLLQAML